jgi:hypothetical protein
VILNLSSMFNIGHKCKYFFQLDFNLILSPLRNEEKMAYYR